MNFVKFSDRNLTVCRTHFNYDVAERGEMSFKRGDVFLVVDTLHSGVVGSWQAARIVRSSPHDAKKGVIPNLSRYGHITYSLVLCTSNTAGFAYHLFVCLFVESCYAFVPLYV